MPMMPMRIIRRPHIIHFINPSTLRTPLYRSIARHLFTQSPISANRYHKPPKTTNDLHDLPSTRSSHANPRETPYTRGTARRQTISPLWDCRACLCARHRAASCRRCRCLAFYLGSRDAPDPLLARDRWGRCRARRRAGGGRLRFGSLGWAIGLDVAWTWSFGGRLGMGMIPSKGTILPGTFAGGSFSGGVSDPRASY